MNPELNHAYVSARVKLVLPRIHPVVHFFSLGMHQNQGEVPYRSSLLNDMLLTRSRNYRLISDGLPILYRGDIVSNRIDHTNDSDTRTSKRIDQCLFHWRTSIVLRESIALRITEEKSEKCQECQKKTRRAYQWCCEWKKSISAEMKDKRKLDFVRLPLTISFPLTEYCSLLFAIIKFKSRKNKKHRSCDYTP